MEPNCLHVYDRLQDLLGEWIVKSKGHKDTYRVGYMFPLRVTEQLDWWPEKHVRERKWVYVQNSFKVLPSSPVIRRIPHSIVPVQVTIGEARMSCQQLWMKEALELLIWRTNRPSISLADSTLSVCSANSSDDSSSSE